MQKRSRRNQRLISNRERKSRMKLPRQQSHWQISERSRKRNTRHLKQIPTPKSRKPINVQPRLLMAGKMSRVGETGLEECSAAVDRAVETAAEVVAATIDRRTVEVADRASRLSQTCQSQFSVAAEVNLASPQRTLWC